MKKSWNLKLLLSLWLLIFYVVALAMLVIAHYNTKAQIENTKSQIEATEKRSAEMQKKLDTLKALSELEEESATNIMVEPEEDTHTSENLTESIVETKEDTTAIMDNKAVVGQQKEEKTVQEKKEVVLLEKSAEVNKNTHENTINKTEAPQSAPEKRVKKVKEALKKELNKTPTTHSMNPEDTVIIGGEVVSRSSGAEYRDLDEEALIESVLNSTSGFEGRDPVPVHIEKVVENEATLRSEEEMLDTLLSVGRNVITPQNDNTEDCPVEDMWNGDYKVQATLTVNPVVEYDYSSLEE